MDKSKLLSLFESIPEDKQQKIIQKRMEFIDSSKGYIVEFSVNVQFVAVTANDYPTFNS